MNRFLISITLFASCLNLACNRTKCNENIKAWILEAPTVLEDFLLVKEEILANRGFIDSFSSQGVLFIGGSVTNVNDFAMFNMPNLKAWFRNGRGYINFSQNDTTACFKECDNGSHSAYGKIQMGAFNRTQYKSAVKIVDTLNLKDNWKAEVTECRGCGD